jgi:hypothetical protein
MDEILYLIVCFIHWLFVLLNPFIGTCSHDRSLEVRAQWRMLFSVKPAVCCLLSNKDRQYNVQTEKNKNTNNGQHNTTLKTKNRGTRTPTRES